MQSTCFAVFFVGAASVSSLACAALAQTIRPLDDGTASPFAINDSGAVVIQRVSATDKISSILIQSGRSRSITASGDQALAVGINNAGVIVGSLRQAGQAFVWQNGKTTDLPSPANARDSGAGEINAKGQILGRADFGSVPHAVLWTNGKAKDLGTLGGDYCLPAGLNDAGQVVGTAVNTKSVAEDAVRSAVLWDAGKVKNLGTLGGVESVANDINDLGQVVGSADTSKGASDAFLWQKGKMLGLNMPRDFAGSEALAISNSGLIVGDATRQDGTSEAFEWKDGAMHDLNDLLPASSDWHLDSATAVNGLGQIIGVGEFHGESRSFLLTPSGSVTNTIPLPDPALAGLAVVPLLALANWMHRDKQTRQS